MYLGYRVTSAINHCRWFFEGICNKIRNFWSRVLWLFGCVDDRAVWDLDIETAEFLAPRLKRLAAITGGYPADNFSDIEAWRRFLLALGEEFRRYSEEMSAFNDAESQSLVNRLATVFPMLWD